MHTLADDVIRLREAVDKLSAEVESSSPSRPQLTAESSRILVACASSLLPLLSPSPSHPPPPAILVMESSASTSLMRFRVLADLGASGRLAGAGGPQLEAHFAAQRSRHRTRALPSGAKLPVCAVLYCLFCECHFGLFCEHRFTAGIHRPNLPPPIRLSRHR